MKKKSQSKAAVTRRSFSAGLGAAGIVAGTAPFNIVRAQGAALKVGVLLPRSGVQAGIGQDCQRGVDITDGILKELGMPTLEIMNADTETKVEVARSRAEKLISDGAQLLVGAFDSGQSTAIAQVAEQKGIPLRHQYCGRSSDHGAGLQVRVSQFPDRAHDSRVTPSPTKKRFSRSAARRRRRRCFCMSMTPLVRLCRGHQCRDARSSICRTRSGDNLVRSRSARSIGRNLQSKGNGRRCLARGQPSQRRNPADSRIGQATLVTQRDSEHRSRLV